jgi:hypothetical protein
MKTVTLTNRELVDLAPIAENLRPGWCPSRLAHTTFRNIAILLAEAKTLERMKKPPKEYEAHIARLKEIGKKHAERDSIGQPKTTAPVTDPATGKQTSQYVFTEEGRKAWAAEVKALFETDKPVMDARDAQMKAYEDALDDEIELQFHTVGREFAPENIPLDIGHKQMTIVLWGLEDDAADAPPKLAAARQAAAQRKARNAAANG